jgi:hypothetical protein
MIILLFFSKLIGMMVRTLTIKNDSHYDHTNIVDKRTT